MPPVLRFDELQARLAARLAKPLPGLAAQLEMAPRPRRSLAPGVDPARPIPAAVLALLFPGESGGAELLLTRRTDRVASHKGQICLPGGALDDGESPLAAALREAEEEVGVERSSVRVLGALTPVFIPVSGFRVEPFVGASSQRPAFQGAHDEVEELLELPLERLLDPGLRSVRSRDLDGARFVIPFFRIAGREVWGATAMVLAELAAVLRDLDPPDRT